MPQPTQQTQPVCLSDLTQDKLAEYIRSLGQPAFRARQIYKWIHQSSSPTSPP